jgi:hypothetical protein
MIAEPNLLPHRAEEEDVMRIIPKEVVMAKRPSEEEHKEP